MTEPTRISTLKDLRAALQLAVGLELSTVPVYLTALYSIEDGANTDAAQTIRSVVMEEMLHMTLAANVLNAIGEVPSPEPVEFQGRAHLSPIPAFPLDSPLISGIGTLELLPLTPAAVDSFVRIEHPLHGAATLAGIPASPGGFRTIGEFYDAVDTALGDPAICPDAVFRPVRQIPDSDYYGGAGHVIEVADRASARAAVLKIVDQGEGLPEEYLHRPAKTVTDEDRLGSGWQMYSHYARFRELQTGRRFRTHQLADETPEGSMLLVDYSAVRPALFTPRNGDWAGGPEDFAMDAFDLAYSRLVDDIYRAFAGEPTEVVDPLDGHTEPDRPTLRLAVHAMYALRNAAVALMRTPNPAKPGHTLCPRFSYVAPGGDRDKLVQRAEGGGGRGR
ncbi:ferritin-like protein [Kitasatospora sp. NBC_00240]|uniref:ferritin-like domain-containing protein n=1 Tax=Kitasatospora sp. NBC_00240 TaxID=2903567 RepID=UPI002252F98A|nr:ferritin-like protein [Kitasatospora sp. NBC_00240]MCX5214325.1 ferritin-like protein [Kitasatospora sp. NBC_00240]